MGETFNNLEKMKILSPQTAFRMKKAVGFRNIAVQNSQQINWEIVFNISHAGVNDFKFFARQINKQILS